MKRVLLDRRKTSFFSDISNDLSYGDAALTPFMNSVYSMENFKRQMELKAENYPAEFRKVIVDELNRQYAGLEMTESVVENISALEQPTTFTVVTGHQLNLFGGPLYIVYKIAHVVKLARKLTLENPGKKVVPLFWMASEDHDFEEINHLHLFGNKVSWNTNQSGPVGRFSLEGMAQFKKDLSEYFQNDEATQEFIAQYYTDSDTSLAQATRRLIHELFGDQGVVIIDGDSKALKRLFVPVLKHEIEGEFSSRAVEQTTDQLTKLGYKAQVTPRAINLFYITNASRTRIVHNEGVYQVGEQTLGKEELLELIESSPESFSPNVVLRPVYQEYILPNLAYIGGGGEMAYWLQLKGVFDALDQVFPLIHVRNSFQVFDKSMMKRLAKLDLTPTDVFDDIHQLKKRYVLEHSSEEIDFEKLDELMAHMSSEMESLIVTVDEGLKGYGQSEITRLNKQLAGVKDKLIRQQKKKFDTSMQQIDGLYDKLFPNNGLQERYENILSLAMRYGMHEFLRMIFDATDPEVADLILLLDNLEK